MTATRTEDVTSARQTVVRALAVALVIVMGALLVHQRHGRPDDGQGTGGPAERRDGGRSRDSDLAGRGGR